MRAYKLCGSFLFPGPALAGLIGLAAALLAACVLPAQLPEGSAGGAGTTAGGGSSAGTGSGGGDVLPPAEAPNSTALPTDTDVTALRGSVRATFCNEFVELDDLPESGDRSIYRADPGANFSGWRDGDNVTLSTDGRWLTNTNRNRAVTATLLGAAASKASIAGFLFNNTTIFLSDGGSYRVEIEDALTVRNWRLTETVSVVQPPSGALFTLINTSRCETVRAQR